MGTVAPVDMDFLFKMNLFVGNPFRRNEEEVDTRECLLLFGAEYFVFHFAIQNFKV